MSNNRGTASAGGIGISASSLLGIAFIILKLCHVIDWSWWWVLAPFWIPFAIFVIVFIGWISAYIIITRKNKDRKNKKR